MKSVLSSLVGMLRRPRAITLLLVLAWATAQAADPQVQPLVEGVQDNQDGTFTVFYGFQNNNTKTVGVPIGPTTNYVRPGVDNQGQPVLFPVGRSGLWPNCAFSLVTPSSGATWYLTSSLTGGIGSGTPRTVSGSSTSPRVPIDNQTLPANQPPLVAITTPTTGSILIPGATPVTVVVDAYDVDGSVISVQLKEGATILGTKSPSGRDQTVFSLAGLTPGTHVLTATATDDSNQTTTSASCSLIIRVAPTLSLARSGSGPVAQGGSVSVVATASDADGTITKVDFAKNGTVASTVTAAPYTWTATNLQAPVAFLSATATDNTLLTASQTLVQLVSLPPTVAITYPANGQSVLSQAGTVTLFAAASDPDGTVASVQFQVNGTLVGQSTSRPYRYQWVIPNGVTSATVVAIATDQTGLVTNSTPVTFTINQTPIITVSQPTTGTVVQIGAPLTIQASATDSDGSVLTMVALRDGVPIAQNSGNTITKTFSSDAPASFALSVQAFDNQGGVTTTSPIQIRVNAPPTVSFTQPTSGALINPGTTTLTATAADADGSVVRVEFYADRVLLASDTTAPYSATWSGGTAGFHTLEAWAYDNNGAISKASVNVNANAAPALVWVSPSANAVITAGPPVLLAVSATDSDGGIAKVVFSEGGVGIATLTTPPYLLSWSSFAAGHHVLTATATDNSGASVAQTIAFDLNLPPTVAITAPTSGTVITAPASVTVIATAADSDGSIASVKYYSGSTLLGTATVAPFQITTAALSAGSYTLTAVATDNRGAAVTSTSVTVVLNALPSLSFTAPVAGAILAQNQPVTLSATAADSDGTITSVAFKNGATVLGTVTVPPYSLTTAFATIGSTTLTAVATDNLGAITQVPVAVTVARAPGVTMTAPANGIVIGPGVTQTLTATATDAAGSITSVAFRDGTTIIATDTTAPYQTTWSSTTLGVHQLTAVATNNLNAQTVSAPVQVTITNLPQVALIQPDNGTVFNDPVSNLTLTAQAADSDGTIAQVQFFDGTTLLGSTTTAPYRLTLATLTIGTHPLTAKAIDNVGGTTLSAPVTVRVNSRPTITLLTPVTGTVLTLGDSYAVTVDAFDREGIAQINLLAGTTIIAQANQAPWTLTPIASGASGSVTLVAQVVDNDGCATTSAPVQVTYNQRPTCQLALATPGATYNPATGLALLATAADSDGTIAKVIFYDGSTVIGEDSTAPYQLQWFGATSTAHVLTAVAVDNQGATGLSGTLTITVNALPQVAITTPINGSSFQAPANVTVNATATDSDGTITSVVFKNGTTVLGTDTASPYQLALTNLAAGSYAITATATDNAGGVSVSAPVAFTVANRPSVALTAPAANALLTAGTSVALSATASVTGGTIRQVSFYDGSTRIGQTTAAPYTGSWIASGSGTHTLTAQALTDTGLTATSSSVTVTVNAPPLVTVSATQQSPNLLLSATATDSDGTITQVRFLANGTALATDTTAPYTYTWLNPAVGTYTVVAEATDNRGAVSTSTSMVVTINSQASVPPTVTLTTPTGGSKFVAGAPISITATAAPGLSGGVPVGTIARVEFYDGATKIGQATSAPYAFTWTTAPSGWHGISALAVSSGGSSTVSSQAIILVNTSPTVAMTAPGAGSIVLAGTALTVSADAADSDGTVTQVEFLDGTTSLGFATTKPYGVSIPGGLLAGSHNLSARATDDLGGITTSAVVTITANQTPTVTLTAPTAGIKPSATDVVLTATAADSDGTIASVTFFANSQMIGSPVTTAPYQVTFVKPASGSYVLLAKATDNAGAVTVSAPVTIQVDAAPTITITAPVSGIHPVIGSSVAISTLAGDIDGSVASVRFVVDGTTTLATDTSAPFTATWTATSGTHSLTAIATDDLGRTTTSAAVSVIGNARPTVAITAPVANASIPSGQAITLTATASDDGSIAKVVFYDGSAQLAVVTTAPYTASWTGASERTHEVTAVVTDNYGLTTTSAPIPITVVGANKPPVVTLTKPTTATVVFAGDSIDLAATASDPDGSIVRVDWTIDGTVVATTTTAPYLASATMPATTGNHVIVARATDNQGLRTLSTPLTVIAKPLANKPQITLDSPVANETDKISDGVFLSATASVLGSTISKIDFYGNGALVATATTAPYTATWKPTALGSATVSAVATDATGGQARTTDVPVTIVPGVLQIVITSPNTDAIVLANQPVVIAARVTSANAVDHLEFYADGVKIGTSSTVPYQITWTPTTVADVVLTAKVFDYGQSLVSAPVTVHVRVDNGLVPTAAITNPATDYDSMGNAGIAGTVTITNPAATLASWRLSVAAVGSGDYRTFAQGTSAPISAVLDTSLMKNGAYVLSLIGTDTLGRSATATRRIRVEDQSKPGQFSFTVQDVVTPVAGIPLAVNRTYNSLNRDRIGDFGYGWSASFVDMEITHDEERIDAEAYDSGTTISVRTGAGGRDVTVTLPDGTRSTFTFDLVPGRTLHENAIFRSAPGVSSYLMVNPQSAADLNVLPGNVAFWTGTYGWADSPWQLYDFPGYILALEDGTLYYLNREDLGDHYVQMADGSSVHLHYYGKPYLDHIVLPTGDKIQVSQNGIQHFNTAGNPTRRIRYQRDGQNRITGVFDASAQDAAGNPSGPATVTYTYSSAGDLSTVQKLVDRSVPATPVYDTTTYLYEDARWPHLITKIIDPNGQPALRCEYDDQGHLVATVDAQGNRVVAQHDPATRTSTVFDRNGKPTIQGLDAHGRVLSSTDALGHTSYQTYDAQGKLLSETDPLGHTTTYTNDSMGHRLTETDALGHTAHWTYDSNGNVLTSTDKNGNVTTNVYTYNQLTKTTDPLGNVTTYAYGLGGIAIETDALGRVTTYGYDADGKNLTSVTDAAGHVTTFNYDNVGNQILQQTTRTRADGIQETLTTQTWYDGYRRVVKVQNPDGSVVQTFYSKQNKPIQTVDALGRSIMFDYSTTGQLQKTTYPDGSYDQSTFDGESRILTRTDRAGRITTYAYDAVGHLLTVLLPDGSSTSTAYDAAGRVTDITDVRGNVTHHDYDAVNRRIAVTNARGEVTQFGYDNVGNQTSVTDAAGHTTQFFFDAMNRRTQVTAPDNSFTKTGYDAVGQRTSEQDQAGKITYFGYDVLGRLSTVTDTLGKVTTYGYDEVGNQTAQIDALNRTTSYSFDKMGRRLGRWLPGGQSESMDYDAVGNLLHATDFRGYITAFSYDALNRRLTKTPDSRLSQPTIQWTYYADGRRATMTDALGLTNYYYNSRGRLIQQVSPQGTLNFSYDAGGNLTRIWTNHTGGADTTYAADNLNRLSVVTDTTAGTFNFGYDSVGNQGSVSLPNGLTTTYGYDTLNRLKTVTRKLGATTQAGYTYALDVLGRRTQVVESGGRTVGYSFDDLSRLTNESITGGTNAGSITIQYDNVGNRQVRTSTSPAVPSTVNGYTANDWLTSDGYDANGNTISSTLGTDTYDSDNHLIKRTLPAGAGTVTIVYDGDGNKVVETAGGVTTTFLVSAVNPTGYAQTIEELVGGTVTRSYVWGNGLAPLAQRSASSGISYPVTDGQGSVRALTNSSGTVTDTFTYDSAGILIGRTGATPTRNLYCGYEKCEPLGQYYLRARIYDQSRSRFWSADTFEGNVEETKTLHKYTYCGNDSVNNFDPSGNEFTLVEMNMVESMQATLNNISTVSYQGAMQAIRLPIYDLYIGTQLYWPGHSGIFLKLKTSENGWLYHVMGASVGPGTRSIPGVSPGVIDKRPLRFSAFKGSFKLNFKVCSLSELQFFEWSFAMRLIALYEMDEGRSSMLYGKLMSLFPGSGVESCHTWAIESAFTAWAISKVR